MSDYGSVTRCPFCGTSFHIGLLQMEAAGGRVRCGGCLKIFDASSHLEVEQHNIFDLLDRSPPILIEMPTDGDDGAANEDEPEFQDEPEAESEPASSARGDDFEHEPAFVATLDHQPIFATRGDSEEMPVRQPPAKEDEAEVLFVAPSRKTHSPATAIGGAIALGLAVLIPVQLIFWQPEILRAHPLYRQMSASVCTLLACRNFAETDISQFTVSGQVRPSGTHNQILELQAELRNLSDRSQLLPDLEVRFSDRFGNSLAERRFSANEYLRSGSSGPRELGVDQRVQVTLELYDPGPEAVGYELNLVTPH